MTKQLRYKILDRTKTLAGQCAPTNQRCSVLADLFGGPALSLDQGGVMTELMRQTVRWVDGPAYWSIRCRVFGSIYVRVERRVKWAVGDAVTHLVVLMRARWPSI